MTTLHVLLILTFLTFAFQAYCAVRSMVLNTALGFKSNKGWFFVTLAFIFSAVRSGAVCYEVATAGYRPAVLNEAFSTVLAFLFAFGVYHLSRPYTFHRRNARQLFNAKCGAPPRE